MSTLQQLIDVDPTILIKVTDGISSYKFSCIVGSEAEMYGGTRHALDEDKWSLDIPTVSLEVCKDQCKLDVDLSAGEARKRYITDIAGQSATYLRKEKHAEKFRDAGYPEADIALPQYRYIKAEVDAREGAMTPTQAADYILGKADMWDQLNEIIESERIKAKIKIDAAASVQDAISERDSAIALLDSI